MNDDVKVGPALSESLTNFLNGFLARCPTERALSAIKKDKEDILIPENCSGLSVPKCNAFVWEVLPFDYLRNNDVKLQNIQAALVKGLVPIAQLLDNLASAQKEKRNNINVDSGIEAIKSSLRMFLCTYTALMDYRASNIKAVVSKDVSRIIEGDKKPSPSNLFGDDFQDKVKNFHTRASFVEKFGRNKYKKGSVSKNYKGKKPKYNFNKKSNNSRRNDYYDYDNYKKDDHKRNHRPQFKERNSFNKAKRQ